MADNRPIGMMDSGFGGVSVLKEAAEYLKHECFVFYGDNGNAPYGTKSTEEIKRLVIIGAEQLMRRHVKCIVIACNTATSAAIEDIRAMYAIPVLSMEPAIKPALEKSKGEGVILMMATPATCSLERYQRLKKRIDTRQQIIDVPCHGLVEMIEDSQKGSHEYTEMLDRLLAPYRHMNISGIVLGCTHFTFVEKELKTYCERHMQGECALYDGRTGTVHHLKQVLMDNGLEADENQQQRIELITTGDETEILPNMRQILNMI